MKRKLLAVIALSAAPAVWAANSGLTLYGDFSISQNISTGTKVWTNATDSTLVAWTQESYGIVEKPWAGGDSFSFGNNLQFYGLRWLPGVAKWCTVNGGYNIHIEDAGLDMPTSGSCLGFGDTTGKECLWLTASQTWTGPADATKRSHVSIGHDNWADYYKCKLNASWCPAWTLRQGVNVWFTWTNALTKTDITVVAPAKLWLEKEWDLSGVHKVGQPALGAKSLKLSGEATMMEFGGTSSINSGRGHAAILESEANEKTLTADLTLDAGADILGTGAGWDIPSLKVTGSGASALLGSWTFRRARTALAIGEGASLSLTGTSYAEAEGVSAGFDVTGKGAFKVNPKKYNLTGDIALSADSTLEFTAAGTFSGTVSGAGTMKIQGTLTEVTELKAADFANLTGTIEVTAGYVAFDERPAATVTVSGTGQVFYGSDRPVLYGDWAEYNDLKWLDENGVRKDWINGAKAVVTAMCNRTPYVSSSKTWRFYKCTVDVPSRSGFWVSPSIYMYFGAGGLEFKQNGTLGWGASDGVTKKAILTADQTWTGPATGTSYAHASIGYPYVDSWKMPLGIGSDVHNWTLAGHLVTWAFYRSDLSQVDVRIESPARLILPDTWMYCDSNEKRQQKTGVNKTGEAYLNARTLTLSGDGDKGLSLGRSEDYISANYGAYLKSVREITAERFAPVLILENGADLTAENGATIDIADLRVKGTGESVLSGSFTFAKPETVVTLSDGGTLFLAAEVKDGARPSALTVNGSGTLKIDPATFKLTGALTLGPDVTLVLVGSGEFSHPFSGGKTIEVAASGTPLTIASGALAGYAGDVTVKSGELILDPVPAGVTVVEDGGTRFDISKPSGDPWVVTDAVREEAKITVGSGETLVVYGHGLTAATELELAGGTVTFRRSTEIASPLTLTATTTVGAETCGVTGLLSGHLDGTSESERYFKLSGAGTVNLSGGATLDHVAIRVTAGSANLMSNRFDLAYATSGVFDGDYLGIRDGAYVKCPWPSKGGVYGLQANPRSGAKAVIEVCSNATVYLEQNCTIYLGNWERWGIFRMSGGTVIIENGRQLYLGYYGSGWGEFEMNDGTFITSQAFSTYDATSRGRVTWRGGCIRLHPRFWTYSGNSVRYLDGVSSNLTFTIAGPNCVLDLNGAKAFTNVVANAMNAESWQWTEGGRLTVTNGGKFVMNRFPANGCVTVKDCSLEIADDRVPAIGEVGFAGTSADDLIVGTVDGLAAERVRVGAGAEWRPDQVVNIGWTDLAFDSGATALLSPAADGSVPTLAVPGKVTFGDELVYRLDRNGKRLTASGGTLISAAGGMEGSPAFTRGVRTPKGIGLSVDGLGNLLFGYDPPGVILLVR